MVPLLIIIYDDDVNGNHHSCEQFQIKAVRNSGCVCNAHKHFATMLIMLSLSPFFFGVGLSAVAVLSLIFSERAP